MELDWPPMLGLVLELVHPPGLKPLLELARPPIVVVEAIVVINFVNLCRTNSHVKAGKYRLMTFFAGGSHAQVNNFVGFVVVSFVIRNVAASTTQMADGVSLAWSQW